MNDDQQRPEELPLSVNQKRELDRRLAAHRADPSKVVPWELIKAEALARLKKDRPSAQ